MYGRMPPRRSQVGSTIAEYLVRTLARYRLADASLEKTCEYRVISHLLY